MNNGLSFLGCLVTAVILIISSGWGLLRKNPICKTLISPILWTSSADQGQCDHSCHILANQTAGPARALPGIERHMGPSRFKEGTVIFVGIIDS